MAIARRQPDRDDIAARLHGAAVHLLRRARSRVGVAEGEQGSGPTMSRLVSWLEREGYVRREAGGADARVVTVRATAKAVRALEAGRRRRVERVRALLGELSAAEWERVE